MNNYKYLNDMWDITEIPVGTILRDWFDEGVRVILMRGPNSINVYLGVPKNHPLAGHSYDDLPVECHGGLTFASEGKEPFPEDYFWYGYDYAHAGDFNNFSGHMIDFEDDKKWTLKEIVDDSWGAIYSFKQLMKLSESIFNKAKQA